jgi:hypothetical protein
METTIPPHLRVPAAPAIENGLMDFDYSDAVYVLLYSRVVNGIVGILEIVAAAAYAIVISHSTSLKEDPTLLIVMFMPALLIAVWGLSYLIPFIRSFRHGYAAILAFPSGFYYRSKSNESRYFFLPWKDVRKIDVITLPTRVSLFVAPVRLIRILIDDSARYLERLEGKDSGGPGEIAAIGTSFFIAMGAGGIAGSTPGSAKKIAATMESLRAQYAGSA